MNKLKELEQKPSWIESFPITFGYQSKDTFFTDICFTNVLQREKTLTFDVNSYSGFKEIDLVPLPYDYDRLKKRVIFNNRKIVIIKIIESLKNFLKNTWDSKTFHVIATSAGRDSRLIAFILKSLQKEGMDLGEFIFLCHGYQWKLFEKVMKQMGWEEEDYDVYRKGREHDIDYYDPPDFNESVNGFQGPQLDFYGCIDKTKSCLISGMLPPGFHDINEQSGSYLRFYVGRNIHSPCDEYLRWKDVLYPYLNYDFLSTIFSLNHDYHSPLRDGSDDLKDDLNKHMGNTLPYYYDHNYNWNFSKGWVEKVNYSYQKSKFVEKFKLNECVNQNVGELIFYRVEHLPSRLWGLATVFEKLNLNNIECKYELNQKYNGLKLTYIWKDEKLVRRKV